jgi:hypothetical protein
MYFGDVLAVDALARDGMREEPSARVIWAWAGFSAARVWRGNLSGHWDCIPCGGWMEFA